MFRQFMNERKNARKSSGDPWASKNGYKMRFWMAGDFSSGSACSEPKTSPLSPATLYRQRFL